MITTLYFVEYTDELGVMCAESWSQATLDMELARGDVHITHIELAWSVQELLGLV